ncbi:unnamed protein product [Cunninghamella blakesleeana]
MMSKSPIPSTYNFITSSNRSTYQNHQFSLVIRQQPIQARVCTNNEKDRKAIEPPPIIQIQLNNTSKEESKNFLQNPFYFMFVNLVHSTTYEDIYQHPPALSGQTVSSMYKLKDITNDDGSFFCFGDLSSKMEGEFRLKFTLCEILNTSAIHRMHIYSQPFHVYHSKNMPKPLNTTFLSRSFADQGVRIRIRKEHRIQGPSVRKRKYSLEENENSDLINENRPCKRLSTMNHLSSTLDNSNNDNNKMELKQNDNTTFYYHQPQIHHLNDNNNGNKFNYQLQPHPLEINHHHQNTSTISPTPTTNTVIKVLPYSPPTQTYDYHSKSSISSPLYIYQHPISSYDPHPHYYYPSNNTTKSSLSPSYHFEQQQNHLILNDKIILPPSPRSSITSSSTSSSFYLPSKTLSSSSSSISSPPSSFNSLSIPTSSSFSSIYSHRASLPLSPHLNHSKRCYYKHHQSLPSLPSYTNLRYHVEQQQQQQSSSQSLSSNEIYNHDNIKLPPIHSVLINNPNNDKNDSSINISQNNNRCEENAIKAMMDLSRPTNINALNHHHSENNKNILNPSRRTSMNLLNSFMY